MTNTDRAGQHGQGALIYFSFERFLHLASSFFRECNPHDSACCLNKVHAFLIWQSNLGKCWGQPVLQSDRGKPGRVRACRDTKGLGSLALWTQLTGHRHGRDKDLVCRAPRERSWLSFVTEVSLGSTGWSGTCCVNGAGTMWTTLAVNTGVRLPLPKDWVQWCELSQPVGVAF